MESAEHVWIGDRLTLKFGTVKTRAKDHYLRLPGGKQLTYGLIIALAGDLYGVVEGPISTAADPEKAFTKAWKSLDEGDFHELQEILDIMREEITAFDQAIAAKEDPSKMYRALGDTLSHRWNGATGGSYLGWAPPGRYLQLSAENWDHFGVTAVAAYQAGHRVAMEQAVWARRFTGDEEAVERELGTAYAMNAFADHFLTDLFSAGHLRVPRKEMFDRLVAPLAIDPVGVMKDTQMVIAGVLARAMHNEDSSNGLMVTNANGDYWRAYGDKRLLDGVSQANREMAWRAAQASADDIDAAFTSGHATGESALKFIPDLADVARLIPEMVHLDDLTRPGVAKEKPNGSPLFIMRQGRSERRNSLSDISDYSWTTEWDPIWTYMNLRDPIVPETKYSHAKCYTKKDQKFVGWLGSDVKGNPLIAREEKGAHGVCWDFEGTVLWLQKDTSGGERWLGLGSNNYATWSGRGGSSRAVLYHEDGTIAMKDDPTRFLFLDNDNWVSWTRPGVDNDNILIVALTDLPPSPDC